MITNKPSALIGARLNVFVRAKPDQTLVGVLHAYGNTRRQAAQERRHWEAAYVSMQSPYRAMCVVRLKSFKEHSK